MPELLTATPFAKLRYTSDEVVNRNLDRLDAALKAKNDATALPATPLNPGSSTPTIGLAYGSDENLNLIWAWLDSAFATVIPKTRFRFTDSEVLNADLLVILRAVAPVAVPQALTGQEPAAEGS